MKTRTKLQLAFKSVLNCLKIEIAFKCQTKFSNHFRFKDRLREDLISGLELFISFSVVSALSRNMERVWDTEMQDLESTWVCHLLLERRSNQPIKFCFVIIYFIAIIYLSFDNFSILGHENKNFLLEIKESFIIMTDKPWLNRNTSSTPLYLFDKVS